MTVIAGAPPRQTTRIVLRAELRRLARRGGLRAGLVTAIAVGVAVGGMTLAVLASIAQNASHVVVTSPIEATAFVTALALAIAVVFLAGRDTLGHVSIALTLTPARSRLHLGRAGALAACGAAATGLAAALVATVALVLGGASAAGLALLGVGLASVAGMSLVLLAFGVTILVGRSSIAILVIGGLLIALPLAAGLAGGILPPALASVVEAVMGATPTPLLLQALAVSTIPSQGADGVILGQLGLVAWGVSAAAAAGLTFARREP
ncbi:MAG: hypothetical protein ACRCSL_09580 [Microbacterium sp.]